MHRTVASKDGGYNVELTAEEAAAMEAEWKKNAEEQAAEEQAAAIEKAEAEKGMNTLCENLPAAEAAALKKMLKV